MAREPLKVKRRMRVVATLLGLCLLVVGEGFLLVPVEAHGFPAGIPVTCGGPYRLLTGDWLETQPEGGGEFPADLRSRWEKECRNQAVRQTAVGVVLVIAGGFLIVYRRPTRA